VGRENLTEGMATLDASGAGIISEVLIRRRTSPASVAKSGAEDELSLPDHHEVLSIAAVSSLSHVDVYE
jgi:hypothetical protein